MAVFRVIYREQGVPPLDVEAESCDVENTNFVFRRTTLVIGKPRVVVVRRVHVADVDRIDEVDGVARG